MPHIYVLLISITIICAAASWFLPAGEFERALSDAGREMVVPGTYHVIESTPVGFFTLVQSIYNGTVDAAGVIFFVFISYASIGLIIASGAFNGLVASMLRILKGSARAIIIPVFITLSGAVMNPFTVGMAQSIADVPQMSGAGYRIICHIILIAVASFFVIRYALKIQADPTKSLVYGDDFSSLAMDSDHIENKPFGIREKLVLATLVAGIVVIVWGTKAKGWYFAELSAVFLLMGLVSGFIMGWGPNEIAEKVAKSFSEIAVACMMIGIARGILVVLQAGHIIDTIVYYLSIPLSKLPGAISAVAMFLVQTGINFFIPSGSGQAVTSMPIMAPLADLIGISRQSAVLAFQFGDGLSNIIWPTSMTPIICGIAGVKIEKWWKWFVPVFIVLVLTQSILMAVSVVIW